MCCIFTCCGWMIDLIQRAWTFTMSCCVSSAVCCVFATASMSGIALGYNYSLAEYIDLKETNVSVYIKRGVFDDEIADDMDWRRSGHKPIDGFIGDNNLKTGEPVEGDSTSPRSGRRLDDSLFESDDQHKFEGSLMKLTAKAPHPSIVNTKGVTSDLEMSEIISKYPDGSLDQLKAIQGLISMRKSADARDITVKEMPKKSTYGYDERYLPHAPHYPDAMAAGRRRMQVIPGVTPYQFSLRQAVPGAEINEPAKWMLPKIPPENLDKGIYDDYDRRPTYPSPVTPRRTPVRPSRPISPIIRAKPTPTKTVTKPALKRLETMMSRPIDRDLEEFKEKLMLEKYDAPGVKGDEFMKIPKGSIKSEGDYYDEDIKGLPVRRKRHIDAPTINNRFVTNTLSNTVLSFEGEISKDINLSTKKDLLVNDRKALSDNDLSIFDNRSKELSSIKKLILQLLQTTTASKRSRYRRNFVSVCTI